MKRHLKYLWAKIRNDFLRLLWTGPNEAQFVEEVMAGLRRDPELAALLDEHESKRGQ